uniref:Uncharacterized protein n=1 Tax=Arundo donax TaxID=35708 RepID=A0A0A9EGA5_ARUDO
MHKLLLQWVEERYHGLVKGMLISSDSEV